MLAYGSLYGGDNNERRDDAKYILRARLGGTYGLSTTGHLVIASWRPSLFELFSVVCAIDCFLIRRPLQPVYVKGILANMANMSKQH